jgi:uncharacterized membrane protein HdeD (DUF308 family)
MRVIGVLLLIVGIMALAVPSITFFTAERVAEAGPFAIDVSRPYTIVLNPLLGVVALAAGVVLLVAARRPSAG